MKRALATAFMLIAGLPFWDCHDGSTAISPDGPAQDGSPPGDAGVPTDSGTPDGTCAPVQQPTAGISFSFQPKNPEELGFDDLPFPCDLFRDEHGKVHLNSMPRNGGRPSAAFAGMLQEAVNSLDGFGLTTGVFLSVAKDLDRSSLPPSTTQPGQDDRVLLFQLGRDFASVPTSVFYADKDKDRDNGGRLVVHPALGWVLKEKTTFALIIKRGLRTAAQEDLVIAPELAKALSGCGDDRANKLFAPLADWMREQRIGLNDVIAATVFTTQSATADLTTIYRDAVLSPPQAELVFSFPNAKTPLADVAGSAQGLRWLIQGKFIGKRYQSATKEDLGMIEHDEQDRPRVKGSEEIMFSVLLPDLPAYGEIPLIIFQHGAGGGRSSVFELSDMFLPAGFAMACIDMPYFGSRAVKARDTTANLTGQPIPDGFGDAQSTLSGLLMFLGIGEEYEDNVGELHPFIIRDSFRQAAADLTQFLTLLTKGDLSMIHRLDPSLASLSFDENNIYYVAQSFGSVIGTVFAGLESRLKGAVLNVGGIGMVFPTIFDSYDLHGFFGSILYDKIGLDYLKLDYSFDPPESEPWTNLFQMAIEAGDAAAYARYIASEVPSTKNRGTNLLIQFAYNDQVMPNRASEAQAKAAGIPYVKTNGQEPKLRYVPGRVLDGGAKDNLNGLTAAASQFHPAGHNMLTSSSDDVSVEEDFPPFKPLPGGKQKVTNPVEKVQQQALQFFATCRAGTCEILDPF